MPKLVSNPDEVTPTWLSEALQESFPGIKVDSFEAKRVGTGQVGDCVRLALSLGADSALGPDSVLGKFPSPDEASRAAGVARSCYLKEVSFYRELAGALEVRSPLCYFAEIDGSESDFVLLLEDLAPAEQLDQLEGCSVQIAQAAVAEMACLHAPRWGDPALQAMNWLNSNGPEQQAVSLDLYRNLLPGFCERFSSLVSEEVLALCQALGSTESLFVESDEERAKANEAAPRGTIVHGDFRLDNLLVDCAFEIPTVAVVDWQTVRWGQGARDLAYFIGGSLTTESRRACEAELLEQYYATLLEFGVSGYGLDDLYLDYRRSSYGGLIMAVIASMLVGATDRGDLMFASMARRHSAHAIDLGATEFLDV